MSALVPIGRLASIRTRLDKIECIAIEVAVVRKEQESVLKAL